MKNLKNKNRLFKKLYGAFALSFISHPGVYKIIEICKEKDRQEYLKRKEEFIHKTTLKTE